MKRNVVILILACFCQFAFSQTSPILSLEELGAADLKISTNYYCEYPDIAVDAANYRYIVYTEFLNGEEQVKLDIYFNEQLQKSYQVSSQKGFEFRPRVFLDTKNTLWITWAAKRDQKWNILLRSFNLEHGFSPEILITDDAAEDMNPEITGNDQGNKWIIWERSADHDMEIYLCRLNNSNEKSVYNISNNKELDMRPAFAVNHSGKLLMAWNRQIGKNYLIMSRSLKNNKLSTEKLISLTQGFNQAPSVAFDRHNRWAIAWQSNHRPDQHIGLTSWIHIKRQGMNNPVVTSAEPDDWFKTGEEQCFEFPEIIFDSNDRLWIFGRPSQGFYAQCIDGNKKSPIYSFHIPAWGGRGQYACVTKDKDGSFISVRRDWRYMYMNSFDPLHKDLTFTGSMTPIFPAQQVLRDYGNIPLPSYPLRSGKQILFGDIHQHSSLSDGRGTADEHLTRSRYCYGQDFCALSDHEWFVANYLSPSEWERIKILGQLFTDPDEFTVIPGYEWTTPRTPKGFGHKNVYFDTWDKPIFSWRFNKKSSLSLFEFCKQNNAIAVPHHVGWTGTDWENHDPAVQTVSEIVSSHGAFEYMGNTPLTHRGGVPGSFIQDALADGHRFGVIGGSDAHGLLTHHGISMKENEWLSGLAGIQCDTNSLTSIFNAIQNRRTYATSGTKILMDFSINGISMGQELDSKEDIAIYMEVTGTAQIKYVTLIRDNQPILCLGKDFYQGQGIRKTFTDKSVKPGTHFYYIRVEQEDGEMAWSSPIWVNKL